MSGSQRDPIAERFEEMDFEIEGLKKKLAESERMRNHANASLGRLHPEVDRLRDENHAQADEIELLEERLEPH